MFDRYLDNNHELPTDSGFIIRHHGHSKNKYIIAWLVSTLFSVAWLYYIGVLDYINIIGISVIIALALAWLVYHANKISNKINIVEFQNLIFASALKNKSSMTAVFDSEQKLIYHDQGFDRVFNSLISIRELKLEHILSISADNQKIKEIIKNNNALDTNTIVTLPHNNQKHSIKISQFTLKDNLSNKYYLVQAQPAEIRVHNIADSLAIPVYGTVGNNIVYANQTLIKLLGLENNIFSIPRPLFLFFHLTNAGQHQVLEYKDSEGVKQTAHPLGLGDINNDNIQYFTLSPSINSSTGPNSEIDDQFWYLFETSPIAQAIINEGGEVEKLNNALLSILRTANKVVGTNLLSYFAPDSIDEALAVLKHLSAKDKPQEEHKPVEVKTINGDMTLLLYLKPLQYGSSNSNKFVVYFIDLTEQKKLELHFAHSQKMQAIGQLAGGIAHDFNNLLTAMIGFCDLLLLRHPAGDRSFADIMQIKQNANRASNLVRQLLAFSRKQVLKPQILDLSNVLSESANLIRRLIGENIKLIINHGDNLKLVKADQGQLEQVIVNLAVNARDAMVRQGTLTIQTSNIIIDEEHPISSDLIAPVPEDSIINGEYVLLEIADTGCGMPKELISQVFEPFFSTKQIGEGTGLGLSTVYGIVRQTGGYIYVKTEENIGTTFAIFLKSYHDTEQTSVFFPADNGTELHVPDLTGDDTILLVEDEGAVRTFSAQALQNKGYKVIEASCTDEALEAFEKHADEIDIIITDVMMPGISGTELIKKLRDKKPDIKVIFMSGYTEDELFKNDTTIQVNFLLKPFTLKQLVSKVKQVSNSN
jgi:PAS domain S-box-containing protein